jgi:hypothetical protein
MIKNVQGHKLKYLKILSHEVLVISHQITIKSVIEEW